VADSTINDFLGRFCSPVGQGTGFVFSLNQDMLFERIYGTIVIRDKLTTPGIQWLSPPPPFPTDPTKGSAPVLERRFNLIKLHGSANWRTSDGSVTMVMGDHKTATIAASPLLAWYLDIFETVLCAGDVHLMVIGYSWSDEHINAAIVRAVRNHRAKIYFWDIRDPRDILGSVSGSDIILRDGFLGKASGTISAVMPAQPFNPITEEYKRIVAEFF
jgi:SIR2-like domain